MIKKFIYLLLVGSTVITINGFALDEARENRHAHSSNFEDCSKFPGKKNMKECCSLPKDRIWGNLKTSFHICFKNLQTMLNEKIMPGNSEMSSTRPIYVNNDRNKKKKNHFHYEPEKEECLMECVFENSGFLLDKKVNKDALLERLKYTLKDDITWLEVTTSGVEKCHLTLSNIRTSSNCTSGAAPIFYCIHKYIFLNCPTWLQNDDYCTNLKQFYQQCPDGPPPPIDEKPFQEYNENSSESLKM